MKTNNFYKRLNFFFFFLALLFAMESVAQSEIAVFVNSRGSNAIKKYDENGNFMGDFIQPNSGGLIAPEDIVFHPDGTMLVTGAGNTAIKRYNAQTGVYMGNFSSGYALETPSKMSIGWDSLLYVTQWGTTQNKVVRFDLQGNFVDEFTDVPTPNGLGHVWDADKNFYISVYGNGGNGTVQKFDSLGHSLGTFINSTILQGPTNIWFDHNGDMLVEDWTVGRVLRYNSDGQYIGVFVDGLSNPEGIAFLPNGQLLIGDWGEDAVHLIDSTGQVLGYFTSGNGLIDPNCVKVSVTPITNSISAHETEIKFLGVSPNPATEFTQIHYALKKAAALKVEVVNAQGQTVAILYKGEQSPGTHQLVWDRLTDAGYYAAPGLYLIRLSIGTETVKAKVIVQ
ncbi:MAG TPA: T9SS type A sorting domain-containing protein [Saprospiraceae bacterium]|nr:T9SS type A sorting domain-containing protein [Saprospiraceae bacterium]HMQ82767.1 T9SS type A sorting domain-containing protein [Saprospiraceae bacterium]